MQDPPSLWSAPLCGQINALNPTVDCQVNEWGPYVRVDSSLIRCCDRHGNLDHKMPQMGHPRSGHLKNCWEKASLYFSAENFFDVLSKSLVWRLEEISAYKRDHHGCSRVQDLQVQQTGADKQTFNRIINASIGGPLALSAQLP